MLEDANFCSRALVLTAAVTWLGVNFGKDRKHSDNGKRSGMLSSLKTLERAIADAFARRAHGMRAADMSHLGGKLRNVSIAVLDV